MRRHDFVLPALIATLGGAAPAKAEFMYAGVENLGDLGAGVNTWRVSIEFSSPSDQLLAISGNADVSPLFFNSLLGDVLRNTAGPFAGFTFEDTPFPGIEVWDSWVTIGTDVPAESDAEFTPGFLGGSGVESVINGTSFSQADDGGWFDSDPGTPEIGGSVLIAQFTVGAFELGGTATWDAGDGEVMHSPFFAYGFDSPAPGTTVLLGLAAVGVRRRRRVTARRSNGGRAVRRIQCAQRGAARDRWRTQ